MILRPGFRVIEEGHVSMLFAAIVFAGSYLLAKIMADEVKATVVVAMLSIFVTIGLAPFALADWVTPSLRDLGLLFAVACFATAGALYNDTCFCVCSRNGYATHNVSSVSMGSFTWRVSFC